IAHRVMLERGLLPDFSSAAIAEVNALRASQQHRDDGDRDGIRDLTALPWCSIDNDDSRDLDQLTGASDQQGDTATVLVAIADVDVLVKPATALDEHAGHNTTSVYTAAQIF